MAERKLELVFKNQLGRTNKIVLENPRGDLTEAEVRAAMQTIIDKNVFRTNSGEFVDIDSAQIVSTDTEVLIS